MILMFELVFDGTIHAPGNSHLIQIIAQAMPQEVVRVHAAASHLAELQHDPDLRAFGNVAFRPIALSPLYRYRTGIVSGRRFWHEFAIIRAAIDAVPPGESCLVILASATSTAICAALLAARLSRRKVGVQVGLHGNLNEILGWRPRNPLRRSFDLRAVLAFQLGGLRFLTFEDCIRRELGRLIPAAAERTDSLPHAVNTSELGRWTPQPLQTPLRIGLVGLATEAKGITPFLETARLFKATYGARIEFHLVGGSHGQPEPGRFRDLAHPVQEGHLTRPEFLARLAGLHYVFLPLQSNYYNLSPSGAVLDAITWLKPVIATRVPLVTDLFAEAGDIGYLCNDVAAMQAVLHAILAKPDQGHYGRQVEALRRVRDRRTPAALAPAFRDILHRGFPRLLSA